VTATTDEVTDGELPSEADANVVVDEVSKHIKLIMKEEEFTGVEFDVAKLNEKLVVALAVKGFSCTGWGAEGWDAT
jgi:hypothetical protein